MHERFDYEGRHGSGQPRERRRHGSARRHRRGGPRARRGDIRAAILALLAERPMHGYEMITELEERTGGMWRPSAGSIYPTLQLLEEQGLIQGEEAEGKRRFTLTDEGRAESEARESPSLPWEEVSAGVHPQALRFRQAALQLRAAVQQVARAGSEDQLSRAADLLDETRRKIYAILAEAG
jgi:DNA-binding PadR family transcriptional regulator